MSDTLERAPSVLDLFQSGMPRTGRSRAARSQEDGRAGTGTSASRGRVLIVEDEYFVALDAEDALSSAGFMVVGISATAEEAIEKAAAEAPDIVLMDIRLAGPRDGIDAAAEIRRRLRKPQRKLDAVCAEPLDEAAALAAVSTSDVAAAFAAGRAWERRTAESRRARQEFLTAAARAARKLDRGRAAG